MSTHTKVLLVIGVASMAAATEPTCPHGYYGTDTECTHSPDCCDPYAGLKCLSKDAYSAYCLPECNAYVHYDWECKVVKATVEPTTVEPTTKEPPSCPYGYLPKDTECSSTPHCCDAYAGLKCISKDAYSAYCLPECNPYVHYDWTCKTLTASPYGVYTAKPTTVEPTTVEPTSVEPTTGTPLTVAPTTVEPTTVEPTTVAPTTKEPPSCPYGYFAEGASCSGNVHCCDPYAGLKCIAKDAYSAYCLPECNPYVHYDWTCTVLYPY